MKTLPLITLTLLVLVGANRIALGGDCGANKGLQGIANTVAVPDYWPPDDAVGNIVSLGAWQATCAPFGYARLYKGCRTHDKCYDEAGSKKSKCDADLKKAWESQCKSTYKTSGWGVLDVVTLGTKKALKKKCQLECLTMVNVYWNAMKAGSGGPWKDAQAAAKANLGKNKASFNKDKKHDLMFFEPGNNTIYVSTSTGNGFGGAGTGEWISANGFGSQKENYYPGDFNGDNVMDLGYAEGNKFYVKLSNSSAFVGSETVEWIPENSFGGTYGKFYVGDFNGDGADDLMFFEPGDNSIHVNLSTRFGFFGVGSGRWIDSNHFGASKNNYFPADFNGDGKTDLGYFEAGNNSFHVLISTGTNFFGAGGGEWIKAGTWGHGGGKFYTGDFNGDKKHDLMFYEPGDKNIYVMLSKGTGFGAAHSGIWKNASFPGFTNNKNNFLPADYNGDGKTDMGYFESGNNSFKVWTSTGTGFNGTNSKNDTWIKPNTWGHGGGRFIASTR